MLATTVVCTSITTEVLLCIFSISFFADFACVCLPPHRALGQPTIRALPCAVLNKSGWLSRVLFLACGVVCRRLTTLSRVVVCHRASSCFCLLCAISLYPPSVDRCFRISRKAGISKPGYIFLCLSSPPAFRYVRLPSRLSVSLTCVSIPI